MLTAMPREVPVIEIRPLGPEDRAQWTALFDVSPE
jgi:hypothetical protein